MFPMPNYMVVIASIGHAILFSLAVSGGARIVSWLLGTPISNEMANSIFGFTALLTMPPAGYFKIARFVMPAPNEQASA